MGATQSMVRGEMRDHDVAGEQVEAIIALVDELGRQGSAEVEPPPGITMDDVQLVCGLSTISHTLS